MAEAESLRQVAQSRAPFSAWIGIVFLFMIFGLIVLAVIGPSPRTDHYEQTRAKKRIDGLKTLRDEETKALTTYAWVDKAKGSVQIPIDRAMELAIPELAQKKPAPAYAIAPPAGAPAPASTPGTALPAGSPAASPASAPAAGPANTPASATGSSTGPTPFPKAKENEGPDSENRNQPAAAANPPGAKPATQPGASATPHAAPAPQSARPAVSPTGTPIQSPAGSPLPTRGKTGMNKLNFSQYYGCC